MLYLLDANVFIQAKNFHYGFDFCPGFWDWVVTKNSEGTVASIDRVENELRGYEDELSEWVANRASGFFLGPNPPLADSLLGVSEWSYSQDYTSAAIDVFLQGADHALVAHGLALDCAVVTHEKPASTAKKIKIPNACAALEVRYMNVFEMLRREQARFVWHR